MAQQETPGPEPQPSITFGATVTILFSDIRGFTEYTDQFGDEAAYRMLQHHNTLLQEQIALYGGHVVKSLGDSYMVSFDAARMAVASAVAMQRAIEGYNRAQEGTKIEIGVGINTGEPVRDADDLFGGAVNLASRICGASGPGRILVSETVRHVVGRVEGMEWLDRGFYEIKGFSDPQHLFEVDWSKTAAVRATPVAAPRAMAQQAAVVAPLMDAAQSSNAPPKMTLPWIGGGVAVAVLLAAAVFVRVAPAAEQNAAAQPEAGASAPSGQQAGVPSAAAPGKLLRSDDFSDPKRGLFLDNQRDSNRQTFSNGVSAQYQWEYGYADRALVFRLKAPSPPIPEGGGIFQSAAAADRVLGDFAVEVRAQTTKSGQGAYSIDYVLAGEDRYRFVVGPGLQRHGISLGPQHRNFMSNDRNSAINRGGEENHLRMEVRGDIMTIFVNGVELDRGQHDGLRRRGGSIELAAGMAVQPPDDGIEVRFTDFKVYSLE